MGKVEPPAVILRAPTAFFARFQRIPAANESCPTPSGAQQICIKAPTGLKYSCLAIISTREIHSNNVQ